MQVPLKHYLYSKGKLFNVVDENRNFRMEGFKEARAANQPVVKASNSGNGREAPPGAASGGGVRGETSFLKLFFDKMFYAF
jgi:superfamily II RNA helicase